MDNGLNNQLRELNEALMVSSVRQHELAAAAKMAEAAVRDSEVRYRRLFQFATDGLLILDVQSGEILDANAAMGGLIGVEPEEMLGTDLVEMGIYRDIEQSEQGLRELQEKQYLRHDRLSMRNRRGEDVEIEMIASVYQEGDRLVAQCRVRDISDRVKMQDEMAEQAEALAGETRRRDEFLAMLSHELRNPLAPIRSAVHLMKMQDRRRDENPIQIQAREIIERQVGNLTKLVNDMLDVSRVISGRIRLDHQIVDVNQIVRHAVETAMPVIDGRGHELILRLSDEPICANADATRLEEVFINLLNNAAKYTPKKGRIEVWCEQADDVVQVRVRDNGPGIDEILLPHIFDLFTQSERPLARSSGGLGIGLSVAHRLVALHGGSIDAKSPVDKEHGGSEFTVRLPLVPATPNVESMTPTDAEHENHGDIRVLIVDDNTDLVMMLSEVLRLEGYSVQSAYTGPEGLKAAKQWRPDIVLLDIGLPGLDGYEVARRLRSDKTLGTALVNMKLIALTGYGRDTDVDLAFEAGFDAHLTKPYEFEELEALMLSLRPKSDSATPTQ